MAELGLIASGMGIASLGLQIGESILKLKDFWGRVKDAPEDVRYLLDEMETLKLLLSDLSILESEIVVAPSAPSSSLSSCFVFCQRGADLLQTLLQDLNKQIVERKIMGGVKAVLKKGTIDKLRDRLRSAQGMLMISYQNYTRYA